MEKSNVFLLYNFIGQWPNKAFYAFILNLYLRKCIVFLQSLCIFPESKCTMFHICNGICMHSKQHTKIVLHIMSYLCTSVTFLTNNNLFSDVGAERSGIFSF
jgi:hypothetical protein